MEDFQEMRARKEEMKRLKEKAEQEASKRKLSNDIERHLKTVMIGALAEMEEEFGVYWGKGKDVDELSPEELEDRERWNKVRTNILNKGNNKIRASLEEISKYTICLPVYKITFTPQGD